MLKFVDGNIFESKCKTLVNPVNCVGVMGAGLAKEFKRIYPKMYSDYKRRCRFGEVFPGEPYLFQNNDGTSILNFPTKYHWRFSSTLSYVAKGLDWFVNNYERLSITSIAFPALGCGKGGLNWEVVKKTMDKYLSEIPIPVEIYIPKK